MEEERERGDTCVFKHTGKAGGERHGKGTIATTSDETQEFNDAGFANLAFLWSMGFALATPLDFSITPEVPNRENEPFANKCSIQTPCHRQSSPLGHQTERGRRQIKCVLNGGHTTTLSARSTLRKIGWTLAKKQFRAQYCRGSGRHFRTREREQDHRTEFFSGDEKMIAIRTHLLTRICIRSSNKILLQELSLGHESALSKES